jgi:adenylate cyclase
VNLASRLESLNKAYGTSILVADPTYRAAESRVVARPVDLVQVKGKHVGVQLFEPLCLAGEDDAGARELADVSRDGFAAYLARDFHGALEHFARVQLLRPGDRLAALFEHRCRTYLADPPPEDWNGIYVAPEK